MDLFSSPVNGKQSGATGIPSTPFLSPKPTALFSQSPQAVPPSPVGSLTPVARRLFVEGPTSFMSEHEESNLYAPTDESLGLSSTDTLFPSPLRGLSTLSSRYSSHRTAKFSRTQVGVTEGASPHLGESSDSRSVLQRGFASVLNGTGSITESSPRICSGSGGSKRRVVIKGRQMFQVDQTANLTPISSSELGSNAGSESEGAEGRGPYDRLLPQPPAREQEPLFMNLERQQLSEEVYGDASTSPGKKRKRQAQAQPTTRDKKNNSLKGLSSRILEFLQTKDETSYTEVADALIKKLWAADSGKGDEKTIRRRVYDALNVFVAVELIAKDGKTIVWKGLPVGGSSLEGTKAMLRQRKAEAESRIRHKQQILDDLVVLKLGMENLKQKNLYNLTLSDPESAGDASQRIAVPFWLVSARSDAQIECEMFDDKNVAIVSDRQLKLHQDTSILQQLGVAPERNSHFVEGYIDSLADSLARGHR